MNSALGRNERIALLGDDIATSLSPLIHSVEAEACGIADFRYDAVDLAAVPETQRRLPDIIARLLADGYTGFNITHPYKQAVMDCLDELSDSARIAGAVNVVVVRSGTLIGHNTDHSGFLAALRRRLPAGAPHGSVLLLGAGGAGSAVAHALCDFGATELRIIDTDAARRAHLATRLGQLHGGRVKVLDGAVEQAEGWAGRVDGIVNATPVGMEHVPGAPLPVRCLEPRQWVADVVYRPPLTELLRAAEHRGCRTVAGTGMFIEQAADTFALLTGVAPDRDRMRTHLHRVLQAAGVKVP